MCTSQSRASDVEGDSDTPGRGTCSCDLSRVRQPGILTLEYRALRCASFTDIRSLDVSVLLTPYGGRCSLRGRIAHRVHSEGANRCTVLRIEHQAWVREQRGSPELATLPSAERDMVTLNQCIRDALTEPLVADEPRRPGHSTGVGFSRCWVLRALATLAYNTYLTGAMPEHVARDTLIGFRVPRNMETTSSGNSKRRIASLRTRDTLSLSMVFVSDLGNGPGDHDEPH